MEENYLISQSEAARLIGISRQAVHKLVKSGKLTVSRIAGRDLLFKKEVELFKQARVKVENE